MSTPFYLRALITEAQKNITKWQDELKAAEGADLKVGDIVVLKSGYGEYFSGGEIAKIIGFGPTSLTDGTGWVSVDRLSVSVSRSYVRKLDFQNDRVITNLGHSH